MTLEQWEARPEYILRMREILNDPAFIAGMEVIRDQELMPVAAPNGVGNLVDFYALMGAKRLGYLEYHTNLKALGESRTKVAVQRKPWESDKKKKD